jgi:hypothetical protein
MTEINAIFTAWIEVINSGFVLLVFSGIVIHTVLAALFDQFL